MSRPLISRLFAVMPLLTVVLASCTSAPKASTKATPTPEVTPSYSVMAPVNKARSKTGAAMDKEFERARQDPEAAPAQ
jgi:hypothetical protein